MKIKLLSGTTVFVMAVTFMVQAQDNLPTKEQQIQAAISAAPQEMQQEAAVMGYNQEGALVTLREGKGDLICLADDPGDSRFHVACYLKDLEPFMRRGRELRAAGKSREEVMSARRSEIESGDLEFPDSPVALYSLTGPENGFDYAGGTVREATPLRVVYIPYATIESTGITGKPTGPGSPWLMDPGKPWAHIMIPGNPITAESDISD